MTQKTTDTFEVRYGRVGAKGITRKYPISRWASISFRQSTTSIGATHRMGVGECHTTYWFLIYSCTICKLFSLTVVTK